MEKYVDLHCHSNYSDGKYSVDELIKQAQENGVDCLSITDHDNINSTRDVEKYKDYDNINLINGVELSTVINLGDKDVYMHLLGYDYDPNNISLSKEMARYRNVLYENNIMFIKRIRKALKYIPDCIFAEFDVYSYRLIEDQIYNILIRNNYSKEFAKNFIMIIKRYIPDYEGYELDIKKAIDLINSAGGISVLAHPNRIKIDRLEKERLIYELMKLGITGIETYHSSFIKDDFDYYKYIALKYGLLESVGSDYHYDTDIDSIIIGHGKNNNLCQSDCSVKKHILQRRRL